MNYDESEYLAQQREKAAQERHNQIMLAIGALCGIILVVFAKDAVLTGFYWGAGLTYVYCFFSYSWVRTASFFALGGFIAWLGGADEKVYGYWLLGAAIVNSAIAQYRKHGTAFYSWWEELV